MTIPCFSIRIVPIACALFFSAYVTQGQAKTPETTLTLEQDDTAFVQGALVDTQFGCGPVSSNCPYARMMELKLADGAQVFVDYIGGRTPIPVEIDHATVGQAVEAHGPYTKTVGNGQTVYSVYIGADPKSYVRLMDVQ